MLKQGVSWIEGLYFGLGLLISGLATYLWMAEHHFRSFKSGTYEKKGHVHG